MSLERLKVDFTEGIRHYVVKGPVGSVVAVVLHTEGFPEELTASLKLPFPFVAYIDHHLPRDRGRSSHGECQYLDNQPCYLDGWSPPPFGEVYGVLHEDDGEAKLYALLEDEYQTLAKRRNKKGG